MRHQYFLTTIALLTGTTPLLAQTATKTDPKPGAMLAIPLDQEPFKLSIPIIEPTLQATMPCSKSYYCPYLSDYDLKEIEPPSPWHFGVNKRLRRRDTDLLWQRPGLHTHRSDRNRGGLTKRIMLSVGHSF